MTADNNDNNDDNNRGSSSSSSYNKTTTIPFEALMPSKKYTAYTQHIIIKHILYKSYSLKSVQIDILQS